MSKCSCGVDCVYGFIKCEKCMIKDNNPKICWNCGMKQDKATKLCNSCRGKK